MYDAAVITVRGNGAVDAVFAIRGSIGLFSIAAENHIVGRQKMASCNTSQRKKRVVTPRWELEACCRSTLPSAQSTFCGLNTVQCNCS